MFVILFTGGWQADTPLSRQHPFPGTATAADGTHSTGMHSCSEMNAIINADAANQSLMLSVDEP